MSLRTRLKRPTICPSCRGRFANAKAEFYLLVDDRYLCPTCLALERYVNAEVAGVLMVGKVISLDTWRRVRDPRRRDE